MARKVKRYQPLQFSNDSAKAIADAVNVKSTDTGVTAEARTIATLSGIGSAGIVSFNLAGTNTGAGEKSPSAHWLNPDDLTSLANAINDQAGNTGIIATLSGDKTEITLTQAAGTISKSVTIHTVSLPTP